MIMDQRDQAPARAEAKGRGRKRGVERRKQQEEEQDRGEGLSNSVDARTLSGSDVVGKGLSYWKWS